MQRTSLLRRARTGALLLTILAAVLGLSTTSASAEAAPEASLTGVASVSAGGLHTCALLTNSQVRCWGGNAQGQLGTGDTDPAAFPTPVRNATDSGPLSGITQLSVGYETTCARTTNAQVLCWGQNDDGELGNGNQPTDSPLPRFVKNPAGTGRLSNVRAVAVGSGDHACAVLTNGQARCWGDGEAGELGQGLFADSDLPVVVRNVADTGPLTGVVQVDLGVNHTCARVEGRQARCWGDANQGQLGTATGDRNLPTAVRNTNNTANLGGVLQVATGDDFSCAIVTGRQVRCWGDNSADQIGNDTAPTDHPSPQTVLATSGTGALSGVRQLTAGIEHACARIDGGQVRCWGSDANGELGNGSGGDQGHPGRVLAPVGTQSLTGVVQVASGDDHMCARIQGGELRCWGYNGDRQLGDGSQVGARQRPVRVVVS